MRMYFYALSKCMLLLHTHTNKHTHTRTQREKFLISNFIKIRPALELKHEDGGKEGWTDTLCRVYVTFI
jgi:hypothetical protein